MRPPQATDHKPATRLRIIYTKKHAPYNAGEERVVEESVARKLCILGAAVPSPKQGADDKFGGWGLTREQDAARANIGEERKAQAGDFADELEALEKDADAEAVRVEREANKSKAKDAKAAGKGFAKGKKGEEASGDEAAKS